MRYSTARSGLLKLALNALITCALSKPISTIFWIVSWSSGPCRNELVDPKGRSAAGVAAAAGAGATGVAAGAAGAGVDSGAGTAGAGAAAGVGSGALTADVDDELAAGVAFGWNSESVMIDFRKADCMHLRSHEHDEFLVLQVQLLHCRIVGQHLPYSQ